MSVRGLVKRFGAVTAVDGLDLELPAASVLALLGPNGAGKTTTVETCEGFVGADSGDVRVLGVDPAGAPDAPSTCGRASPAMVTVTRAVGALVGKPPASAPACPRASCACCASCGCSRVPRSCVT